MDGRRRGALLLAVLGTALLLPAPDAVALRFTAHLDALEVEIQERDAALATPATPEEKREKKAYGKALAALGGDAFSLLEELKMAGKVAKTLEKALPEDEEIAGLLADATEALEEEAGVLLEELETEVDGEEESKAKLKAGRTLDLALGFLESAGLEAAFAVRMKFLLKAIQKTNPVQKFLAGGGGGGGGGGCYYDTRALGAGEHATASWEGGSFTAGIVREQVQTEPYVSTQADFVQCSPTEIRMFVVFFNFTPEVGTPYAYGGTPWGVYTGVGEPGGLIGTSFGTGTLTFTEVNVGTGTYAGTFTFNDGSMAITDGSFRIVGLQ